MNVKQIDQPRVDPAPPSPRREEGTITSPDKAPYIPPAVVRHGTVQRVTLGGGSFIP